MPGAGAAGRSGERQGEGGRTFQRSGQRGTGAQLAGAVPPGGGEPVRSPMQAFFGPQGLLQRAFGSRFEPRPQQLLMAEALFHALSRGGVAMVEAGTGVGKSLAYLVPLLEILRSQGQRRAVVSTHTLHLQDQLLHKDLPVAMQALDACVVAAVAKGWGNYLCRLRLERWLTLAQAWNGLWPESPLPGELARWAETTATGSRSELSAELEPQLWEAVAADPDRCGRRRCPLYEQCFFFQARQRLQQAALVVANHALLLADVALRRQAADAEAAVLPDYQYLVVDEAHHLEDVA
ncbi:MAG TPA: DEAD/DEAH box helicase, partial [Limnochordales bacterium]